MTLPTGEQYELETSTSSGELRATITGGVAASLRALSIDGIDLVPPYGEDQTPPPSAAGIVLVPWPNRIRDGKWTHDGVEHSLAITEPKLNNAIHGLLRYTEYREVERERDSVTLRATIFPPARLPLPRRDGRALRARRRRAQGHALPREPRRRARTRRRRQPPPS